MAKTQENLNKDGKEKYSFRIYYAIILALLATIGLLNRSLGSFLTFMAYVLFGDAYILFFIYLFFWALYLVVSKNRKFKRVKLTTFGLFLILAGITMLLFRAEYPNPSYSDIGDSIKNMGPFGDAMGASRPSLFNGPKGGALGGLLYTSFFFVVSEIGAVILTILIIVTGALIVIWPLIVRLVTYIKGVLKVKEKKKTIFEQASEVPVVSVPRERKITPAIASGQAENNLAITIPVIQNTVTYEGGMKPLKFSAAGNATIPSEMAPKNVSIISEEDDEPDNNEPVRLKGNINKPIRFNIAFGEEFAGDNNALNDNITPSLLNDDLTFNEVNEVKVEPQVAPRVEPVPAPKIEPIVTEVTTPEPQIEPQFEEKTVQKAPVSNKPKPKKKDKYIYPGLDLLTPVDDDEEDKENIIRAEEALNILNQQFINLGIGAQAISYTIGPAITRFDIKMNANESVNTITKYIPDLNIRLGGIHGRFEQVVVGKSTSGFEIPNKAPKMVHFLSCMEKLPPISPKTKTVVPFGMNISGDIIYGHLDEFPHLLVAGATGSGKTVYVHSIIMTLMMRNTPDELRFVLVDPKRVDLSKYADMPHLLCPIIKEPKEAKVALFKLVDVMDERYRLFEQYGASKISEYNEIAEEEDLPPMARIVVIVDEYADLAQNEPDVSTAVVRLAQKSRACGIHLVICTQRPSVDVITGVIKANLPTRVALMVSSAVDSKTVLGQGGAEELLGKGDMLVDCAQISKSGFTRIQSPFVSSSELRAVVRFLKERNETVYDENFLDLQEKTTTGPLGDKNGMDADPIYEEVKEWVKTQERVSKNRLTTVFRLGFNRAANIYAMLLADGVIVETDEANSSRGALVVKETESPSEAKISQFFE